MDTWPRHLFAPRNERWSRSGGLISGGVSLSGLTQTARTDGGGFWMCEQSGINLHRRETYKAWRAWETVGGDGVTAFVVPMCERRFAPVPATFTGVLGGIPHSDGALFDGGAGYSQTAITAAVSTPAALRATTLAINITVGDELQGGEMFSIDHPNKLRRLYAVGRVVGTVGTVATVTIWPPLREAVTTETIDFDTPGCTMRVADPAAFAPTLELGRLSRHEVSFVEAF